MDVGLMEAPGPLGGCALGRLRRVPSLTIGRKGCDSVVCGEVWK